MDFVIIFAWMIFMICALCEWLVRYLLLRLPSLTRYVRSWNARSTAGRFGKCCSVFGGAGTICVFRMLTGATLLVAWLLLCGPLPPAGTMTTPPAPPCLLSFNRFLVTLSCSTIFGSDLCLARSMQRVVHYKFFCCIRYLAGIKSERSFVTVFCFCFILICRF